MMKYFSFAEDIKSILHLHLIFDIAKEVHFLLYVVRQHVANMDDFPVI